MLECAIHSAIHPITYSEGILATVVKIVHIQKALRYRQNL